MSIALIVTHGFGNGALSGTIKDVVLRGFGIAQSAVEPDLANRIRIVVDDLPRRITISTHERITISDAPHRINV